jgi:hypothetical protein
MPGPSQAASPAIVAKRRTAKTAFKKHLQRYDKNPEIAINHGSGREICDAQIADDTGYTSMGY